MIFRHLVVEFDSQATPSRIEGNETIAHRKSSDDEKGRENHQPYPKNAVGKVRTTISKKHLLLIRFRKLKLSFPTQPI